MIRLRNSKICRFKIKTFTFHHQKYSIISKQNTKSYNLPGFLSEYLVRHNCNHRSESDPLVPNFNTGQNSISYFGSVIRNSHPPELRKASSYQLFKSEIKKCRSINDLCRLCKNYLENVNTSFQLLRYVCILFHNRF